MNRCLYYFIMFQANINVFEVDFGMVKRFLSEVWWQIMKFKVFIVFFCLSLGACNSAEDEAYQAQLNKLKQQEIELQLSLEREKKQLAVEQKQRQDKFLQEGGTLEQFNELIEKEKRMTTEQIVLETQALKKQVEAQTKMISSLEEEAIKLK